MKWKCDFCSKEISNPAEGWTYQARPFSVSIGRTVIFKSDEGWLACDTCAALIETGQAGELEERAVKSIFEEDPAERQEEKQLRALMHTLHTAFWAGRITGEVVKC